MKGDLRIWLAVAAIFVMYVIAGTMEFNDLKALEPDREAYEAAAAKMRMQRSEALDRAGRIGGCAYYSTERHRYIVASAETCERL